MVRKGILKAISITLILLTSSLWTCFLFEDTSGIAGSILLNDTWSGYINVTGNLYIETGVSITVSAGTTIEVMGDYGIFIAPNAILKVEGTSGNEVTIFNSTENNWKGIYLNDTSSKVNLNYTVIYNSQVGLSALDGGTLTVRNCTINNSGYGIWGEQFDPLIENSLIHNCSFPLFFVSVNGTVENCDFINNSGQIIWTNSNGKPVFDKSRILNSGTATGSNGIEFSDTNINFSNNTVDNSGGHGVTFGHCSAYVYNNLIKNCGDINNGAGLYLRAQSGDDTTIFENNNIFNNKNGLFIDKDPDQTEVKVQCIITNNEIHHNQNAGVSIYNKSTPDFQHNIVHNNSYGIDVFNGDFLIANSSIIDNTKADFHILYDGRTASLNNKFDTVNVTVNRSSQFLIVMWYLDILVRDNSTKQPIANIDIKIASTKSSSNAFYHRKTDAKGETNYIHIVERTIHRDISYINSPFNISAADITVPITYIKKFIIDYPVTSSKKLIIDLSLNLPPTVPKNIKPTTTHKTLFRITWSPSFEPNGERIFYHYKFGTALLSGNIIPETRTPNTYMNLGLTLSQNKTYYFCVKAGDESYLNSTWSCAAIHIQNIHPSAPTIKATPDVIHTYTPINVNMTSPAKDDPKEVSDFGESIKYSVLVKINDVIQNGYTKIFVWEQNINFTINPDDFKKDDIINITVIPYDGHSPAWNASEGPGNNHTGTGTRTTLILHVNNAAPAVNMTPSDILFDEDEIYTLPNLFTDIFSDPDNDLLKFVNAGTENIDVYLNEKTKQISLIPAPDYFTPAGTTDHIIIGADDSDGGVTNITLNVKVNEVNDVPTIHVRVPQVAYQGKRHYINITATDTADPHDFDDLMLSADYSTWPFSGNVTMIEHSKNNITLYFTPANDDIGNYNLTIKASDGKEEKELKLAVTVENVNDRPDIPIIISPRVINGKVNQIYNTTNEIEFEVITSDPDERWGDKLSVIWKSNISDITIGNKNKFAEKIDAEGNHKITIIVTDSGGYFSQISFEISIVDPYNHPLPRTELVFPFDEMYLPSLNTKLELTLNWEPVNHKYSGLFEYDLEYWIDDPNSKSTKIVGLTTTEYLLGAEVEKTYFWWVIPHWGGVEGVEGECFSGKWQFTINFEEKITPPSVELVNPISGQTFENNSVQLEWTTTDLSQKFYYYRLYIDKNPKPTTLYRDHIKPDQFIVTGLMDKTDYYWDIVPVYGLTEGSSTNGPLSFSVDSSFIPAPLVEISGDPFNIKMEIGENRTLTYLITNSGNTFERFTISVEPDNILAGSVSGYDEKEVVLPPGGTENVQLSVDTRGLGKGTYNIKLKVVSEDYDPSDTQDIEIRVKEKDEKEGPPYSLIAAVIVVVLIVVLLLIFLLKRMRIPGMENETAADSEEKPGEGTRMTSDIDGMKKLEPRREKKTELAGEGTRDGLQKQLPPDR